MTVRYKSPTLWGYQLIAVILSFMGAGCEFGAKKEPPNTLHVVSVEKIKGLDPIFGEDLYSNIQISQAYEPLLGYHYLKRPYVLAPKLADAMPEISPDGLKYTFHIKKGVVFQDDPSFKDSKGKGRELTAEDFVYSYKRLADPHLPATTWWVFDGKILGLNEWREQQAKKNSADYAQVVEGLKALDRYTLQIKLTQKSSLFLYFLAMPYTSVVPREAVEYYGKDFGSHAVGTGPFQLSEYQPSSRIVWIKNPTFRKELYPSEGEPGDLEAGRLEDAGKQLPLADRLVFNVIVEQQPMWLNFLTGKLDYSAIPKDNFSSSITPSQELTPDLTAKHMRLHKANGLDIVHTSFNMADPILGKNKYLRQAMSLAYDGKAFIDIFYNGRAIEANGPIPPGIAGFDAKKKSPYRKFNVLKAKELLVKAGYPDGQGLPAFEYATLADSTSRQQAEFIQKMFAPIGIKLNVTQYSWPQFLQALKTKKAQLWSFAWSADYPDAENFLQVFYGKNASPGPNDSNYSNPEFDRLYDQALVTLSEGERIRLYQKMVDILVEDCPWIFEAHRIVYAVTQGWLKNYKPHDFDHSRFRYYRVEPDLKK